MKGELETLVRVEVGPVRYAFPTYRLIAQLDDTHDLIAVRDDDVPDAARPLLQYVALPGYGLVIDGIPKDAEAVIDPVILERYGPEIQPLATAWATQAPTATPVLADPAAPAAAPVSLLGTLKRLVGA